MLLLVKEKKHVSRGSFVRDLQLNVRVAFTKRFTTRWKTGRHVKTMVRKGVVAWNRRVVNRKENQLVCRVFLSFIFNLSFRRGAFFTFASRSTTILLTILTCRLFEIRGNMTSMSLEGFCATLTVLVLWTCLDPSMGWPVPENNTTFVETTRKFIKPRSVFRIRNTAGACDTRRSSYV